MKLRYKAMLFASLAGRTLSAWTQHNVDLPPLVAQVRVIGSQTDTDARREFVAGKIVIGRKRIEESGMRTVEDILRREPAVTISGNGSIGLHNMPGYTQILIDGQSPTPGQSPDRIDLTLVEKVEIIKSSVAEHGPFGIAGTINIVMRKTVRKTNTDFSAGFGSTGNEPSANAALSHSQSTASSPLRFSARLSADRASSPSDSRIRQTIKRTGQGEQDQLQADIRGSARYTMLTASGSLTWERGSGETISLSPDALKMTGPTSQNESRRSEDGTTLDVRQVTHSSLESLALPLKWSFKPSQESQVELSGRTYWSRMDNAITRADTPSAKEAVLRNSLQSLEGNTNSAELVYKVKLRGGHGLKSGASVRRSKQDVDYTYRVNSLHDTALDSLGTHRHAISKFLRLYLQDEWRVNESWAVNAGISGQETAFDVVESSYREEVRFRLWSPSLHVSKKFGSDDKRQLRVSLARSFNAPDSDAFTARPTIHPLTPCSAHGDCGPNTIATADKSGNPGLKAEKSRGLNLSYEHGFGNDSQVTLEVFSREITGKTGSDITLMNVPWSISPRYVSRPANLGDASTSGVNLEIDLAVRDIDKAVPNIVLRGSAGLARSRVSNLPGPDNRLDKQTPWTAKLGTSYAMKNFALKFDVDANWSPSVWVRTSLAERIYLTRRFDMQANVNWAVNKDQRLVISATSRSPHSARQINDYIATGQVVREYSDAMRYGAFSVRFESKL